MSDAHRITQLKGYLAEAEKNVDEAEVKRERFITLRKSVFTAADKDLFDKIVNQADRAVAAYSSASRILESALGSEQAGEKF